jgi:hypothetical protein
MAIKNGKINPLNVLGIRRVEFPAHHFSYTAIPKYNHAHISKLNYWIYQNLNGRYYIGQYIGLASDGSIIYTTRIGFESEKELSFFTLACPDLN